tara:strand:+ start:3877 stop:4698 length:822 start_codon:yes stop_codon:yes gene_type:complete
MDIIFTLVLYNNSPEEIDPLISSINNLKKINKKIFLSVHDNGSKNNLEKHLSSKLDSEITKIYHNSKYNVGFGKGHNCAYKKIKKFLNKNNNPENLLIVVNPDIFFEAKEISKMIRFISDDKNNDVVCISPLIYNNSNKIQHSAKRNPTILSLLIGRLNFLEKINILQKYLTQNQNRELTGGGIFESSYLSGCFLLIKAKIFEKIKGFDERYFLHFEDADITRELSKYGKCIHFPKAKINHLWQRGSHKSKKQTIYLIQSMIKYFNKWGLSIF